MKKYAHVTVLLAAALLSSCISIEDIAVNSIADMLSSDSGAGSIFTSDEDPALIGDALPFALKFYELILGQTPDKPDLNIATGRNFVMYANAFVQTPAGMLPDDSWREKGEMLARAKAMYLRGAEYLKHGIDLKHPGFAAAMEKGELTEALLLFTEAGDADALYWYSSAMMGAYSCDPFDLDAAVGVYKPAALLLRALELNPEYGRGALHDLLIQVYGKMPYSHIITAAEKSPDVTGKFLSSYYKGGPEPGDTGALARYHFERSQELSGGMNPGTYIALATSVSQKNQDYREFRSLLEQALEIDPADAPDNSLVIIIYRRKAKWLLEHEEDFFIIDSEDR